MTLPCWDHKSEYIPLGCFGNWVQRPIVAEKLQAQNGSDKRLVAKVMIHISTIKDLPGKWSLAWRGALRMGFKNMINVDTGFISPKIDT